MAMATPRSARLILDRRLNDPWLLGWDSQRFWRIVEQRIGELEQYPPTTRILLADADPVQFLAGFFAACATGHPLFLGHAGWSEPEWETAVRVVQPDLVWSDSLLETRYERSLSDTESDSQRCTSSDTPPNLPLPRGCAVRRWSSGSPYRRIPYDLSPRQPDWLDEMDAPICIPTGGTSGQLRFVVHTWDTLLASVQGMQAHFGVDAIHSYCVLPVYHVSGLMQAVRSLVAGGTLAIASPKNLTPIPQDLNPRNTFLSLVPTQLQRLLAQPSALRDVAQFRAILIGGAPAWPALLNQARQHHLPLAPTYGMTEAASQVATLHPEEFLAGATHVGRSLPHVRLTVVDSEGQRLAEGQIGRLQIQADSLAWGDYPGKPWRSRLFLTDDMGVLDAAGHLRIQGRYSNKIITGGENVYPAEVEAAILATGLVQDVCVLGQPDTTWGEVVTAIYVPRSEAGCEAAIVAVLRSQLSPFKIPKRWIAQSSLPRNAQGKLNRVALRQRLIPISETPAMDQSLESPTA